MRAFLIVLKTLLFCFVLAHLFPAQVHAQSTATQEFFTGIATTYTVGVRGDVQVRNNITLRNNFSSLYATQYAFEVGSGKISGIKALDSEGKDLTPQFIQSETKTSITITFKDKVIGKDKERRFVIEYEHPESVIVAGNTMEIDIPKVINTNSFQDYVLSVSVPKTYGEPAVITPTKYIKQPSETTNVFIFSQQAKEGVNMLFGEKQAYEFSLTYNLHNPMASQGVASIALPPDTAYQKVQYTELTPKPDKIQMDEDGNWIATYTLGGQKEQQVIAKGTVAVYLKPSVIVPQLAPLPEHTRSTEYWNTNDPKIQELAKKLKTPKAIHQYVAEQLKYDFSRLNQQVQPRKGGSQALQSPATSLCQDFTDLFISIARAAGIPAREVNGFAYTNNPRLRPLSLANDVLHSWPEYYDTQKKMWIPIDPTWQNTTDGVDFFTKLDFHHFAFAFHGMHDNAPFAAGFYKIPGKEQKDVEVRPITQQEPFIEKITLLPPEFAQNQITVRNDSGSAWYNLPIAVQAREGVIIEMNPSSKTLNVLPYESVPIAITAKETSLFSQDKETVKVTVSDQEISYEINANQRNIPIFLAIAGGISILTVFAGSVLVFRRARQRTVRR